MQQQLLYCIMAAHEIVPYLYLGDINASKSRRFFDEKRIKALINCSKDIPVTYSNVQHMRVPVNDTLKTADTECMIKYLPTAVAFVFKSVFIDKKPILVHCYAGMQRSACVVVCFLMKYYNMTPLDAINYVLSKRPVAFHNGNNVNFEEAMQWFYNTYCV